jgi:ribosome-associated protein
LKPGLSSQDKVREGLTAALDRKASAVLVFNLVELTTMADYFVLSTASSDRQARAIAEAIAEKLGPASSVEGMQTANWILLDYGDVVFHVFQEQARRFYALERLWGDAPNETGVFGGGVRSGASTAPESKRPS